MPATLSPQDRDALLKTLEARFEKHKERHKGVSWDAVEKKLAGNPKALAAVHAMEETGGEPDVVVLDKKTMFVDCAEESPKGRRSLCYDDLALRARKENKPKDSAMNLAEAMGIELLSEAEYRALQELGEFDRKTSSWILTTPEVRKLGGALFCDRRYDTVFTYHNGADSYYAARAFRGKLKI